MTGYAFLVMRLKELKIFASDARNVRHALWRINEFDVEASTQWFDIESEEVSEAG